MGIKRQSYKTFKAIIMDVDDLVGACDGRRKTTGGQNRRPSPSEALASVRSTFAAVTSFPPGSFHFRVGCQEGRRDGVVELPATAAAFLSSRAIFA